MRTLFTLVLLLFNLVTFSQTDQNKINNIRKVVTQINQDSGYTIKRLENEQFLQQMSDEGGELTAYFKNGILVKIVEWVGLSSCINITEYYLQNNKLIFTYTKGSVYCIRSTNPNLDYCNVYQNFASWNKEKINYQPCSNI